MKVVRYIRCALILVWVSSCADVDLQPNFGVQSSLIQIVPRVIPFSDSATKADELIGKEAAETNITCMAIAIFDNSGKCINFQFKEGSDLSFILDRKALSKTDDDDPANDIDLDNASIYAFANIPDLASKADWKDKDIAHFDALPIEVDGVTIPTSGLPMRGVYYGKTDQNGVSLPNVDLDPSKPITSPLVTIDLYSAYAKVVVNVSVDAKEFETIGLKSFFTPTNWQVFNVPKNVDFLSTTNSDTDVWTAVSSSSKFEGIQAIGTDKVSFSFYLPERYLRGASDFTYPFVDSDGNIRPEDESLRQKYKKEHLTSDQKATYVKLTGNFSDYQGHKVRVEYDLYVGGNEYDDFNVKRNCLYTNNVVIRSTNQSNGDFDNNGQIDDVEFINVVSYDGRVNIYESSVIVKLERETVLDAHWEIRPMRISVLDGEVTVSIENASDTPWIRMENSTAVENASTENKSLYLNISKEDANENDDIRYGKRKYFTTDLLTQLSGNTSYRLEPGEHCIWIYVDENTAEAKDDVRKAVISIDDGVNEPIKYTIAQKYILPIVTNTSRTYYIETYEEYLYNYDAMDGYGQTEYNGMPWGLNGKQLSNKYDSFICNEINSDWTSFIQQNPLKYDFYIGKHDDDNENSDEFTKDGGTLHNYAGQEFTKSIAENPNSGVEYLTLGEQAESAVEYCYSRNKRNSDGTVDVKWYLPSADELEDFIVAAYSDFKEFQDNYYWTSQPAYIRNAFYYEYFDGSQSDRNREDTYVFIVYEDNKTHARATKVAYINGKYDYVPSGLNRTSENATIDCNSPICKDTYFNVMYGWYRWTESEWSWSDFQNHTVTRTLEKIGNNAMTADEHYNEYIDGNKTGIRYHVELGHLDDLMQEGYQPRTKKNRVRCAYKKAN